MAYHNEIQARKSRPNGSFKLMDDEVDKEWRRIAFDIRQFVLQILTVEPFRVSAPKGTNHQEIEALKRIQKKTPELAPFKFQKYIWERLVTDVFQAGVNTWGGPTGQAFNLFCLDISSKIRLPNACPDHTLTAQQRLISKAWRSLAEPSLTPPRS
jgi:hypothetical protein